MNGHVWQQPVLGEVLPRAALSLPGLEALQLFSDQKVLPPPIGYLTGMRFLDAGPGSSTFDQPLTDWLLGPQGRSFLGVLAILADGPLGCAIHTTLPAGVGYTTTELALSLVRPIPTSGLLTARGRSIYTGHSTALSDAEVVAEDGRLIAHCTTRCAVFAASTPEEKLDDLPVRDTGFGVDAPFRQPVRGQVLPDEVWDSRTGLEVLLAQIAGELPRPPIGELLGLRPLAASEGSTTFALPAHGWLSQPLGFVEGGVTACLADAAMSAAVQTTVQDGRAMAPVDLRVNFLRPAPLDGRELVAHANVVHRSRSMAYTSAEVRNEDGKLVAIATSTSLYR